jgi:hypothetical protein
MGPGSVLLWMVVLVLATGYIGSIVAGFEFTDAATGNRVV